MLARVMSFWGSWADRSHDAVVRPTDAPRASASGYDMDRVLILGTGPATGWGVTTHDLALTGALARAVSVRTGRGASVELLERPRMRAEEALGALDGVDLARFDAIVLLLGVSDAMAMTSPTRFEAAMSALVDAVLTRAAVDAQVLVGGIPPIRSIPGYDSLVGEMAETRARALEAHLIRLCDGDDQVVFVPLPRARRTGPGEPHSMAAQYSMWAGLIAEAAAPVLDGPLHIDGERRQPPTTPVSEGSIEDGVAELARQEGAPDDRLGSIVDLAKRAFQTDTAFIALLGDDLAWRVVRSKTDLAALPDVAAFCTEAIAGAGPIVVRDAPAHPRLGAEPAVADPHGVRFFAGYPLEAAGGVRRGVLGVLDSVPRRRDSDVLDEVFLQELAILAQQSLWQYLE